ncbi:MAG: hypothetical protein ACD_70C00072G0001 [uncultured bacterium]|nr:MAG: hypothetical protein ACD_70C00072G0001 [uncultured bacterium]
MSRIAAQVMIIHSNSSQDEDEIHKMQLLLHFFHDGAHSQIR